MKVLFLSCCLLLIHLAAFCQSISPYTLNSGGGFSTGLEWSLGESVSIASFVSTSLTINTGVLQPQANLVTAISEFPAYQFSNQILIGPNPVVSSLHLDLDLLEAGELSYALVNLSGVELYRHEAGLVFGNYSAELVMDKYASGAYFILFLFRPILSETRTAIFKLIKL
jgi:hypothetical protein